MQKNKGIYVLMALLCISMAGVRGQTSVGLTYEEYMITVLKNNPLAKRAENEKRFAELQLKAARGNYDPMVQGDYNQKDFKGSNYYTLLNGEIKQPLFTSQYLKFGYEYGVGTNLNPENATSPQGLPYLGLEVGVLQGLMIDKRRAEVLKSREYLNYYDSERQIQLNDLLFASSMRYFDWLFSARLISLNTYFMEVARTRLLGIEALANIGERAAVDTVEAAILYQTRQLDLQAAQIENQKSINELSVYYWLLNKQEGEAVNYIPLDSLDAIYDKAKNSVLPDIYNTQPANPVIQKYASFNKILEVEARFKKEMIKPVLNVKYNVLSSGNDFYNPAFSNNNYKWGVNLSFPLLLRNPVNEFKMARVQLQNNSLELSNKSNELRLKLNALQQALSILSEQLLTAEKSARYSEQLLEAEKLKFENGESSLFMLNTRENKLLETELKLAEYKLKFLKTYINIKYLNGNLDYTL